MPANLLHQRQNPHRRCRAVFQFGRSDHNHSSRGRSTIKVGNIFQLVDAMRQSVLPHRKASRLTVINAQGINPQTQRIASFHKKLRRIREYPGKCITPRESTLR